MANETKKKSFKLISAKYLNEEIYVNSVQEWRNTLNGLFLQTFQLRSLKETRNSSKITPLGFDLCAGVLKYPKMNKLMFFSHLLVRIRGWEMLVFLESLKLQW